MCYFYYVALFPESVRVYEQSANCNEEIFFLIIFNVVNSRIMKISILSIVPHTIPEFWRICVIIYSFSNEELEVLLTHALIMNDTNSAKQMKLHFYTNVQSEESKPVQLARTVTQSVLPSGMLHSFPHIFNFIETSLWKQTFWHFNILGNVLKAVTEARRGAFKTELALACLQPCREGVRAVTLRACWYTYRNSSAWEYRPLQRLLTHSCKIPVWDCTIYKIELTEHRAQRWTQNTALIKGGGAILWISPVGGTNTYLEAVPYTFRYLTHCKGNHFLTKVDVFQCPHQEHDEVQRTQN